MKDPMMLLHMHKLWGNKKPRAILYNCFEWVMGQKQQDRLCGGLDFTHNTLFRGRTLHREPAVMLRNVFKVEHGRTNHVKYSDDNNPLSHTCAGGQSRAAPWLPPSGTPRRHPARRWRDHLSAAFLSVNSLSPMFWRTDLRAQQPLQQARQTQRHRHQLWSPRSRGNTRGEACARDHTHIETFCHSADALRVIPESAFSLCPSTTIKML